MTKENDWIDWTGGECPVPADSLVQAKTRSGSTYEALAGVFSGFLGGGGDWWSHTENRPKIKYPTENVRDDDIIAYRVVSA